jgi:hypothetical protein
MEHEELRKCVICGQVFVENIGVAREKCLKCIKDDEIIWDKVCCSR